MKKTIVFIIAGVIFVNSGLYAASGDMIVNGNLGVGTSTTNYRLDVAGAMGVGGRIFMARDGANNSWLGAQGSGTEAQRVALGISSDSISGQINALYFNTMGFSRLYIATNGNLGIGTTSPNYKLDVAGALGVRGDAVVTGNLGVGSRILMLRCPSDQFMIPGF